MLILLNKHLIDSAILFILTIKSLKTSLQLFSLISSQSLLFDSFKLFQNFGSLSHTISDHLIISSPAFSITLANLVIRSGTLDQHFQTKLNIIYDSIQFITTIIKISSNSRLRGLFSHNFSTSTLHSIRSSIHITTILSRLSVFIFRSALSLL